MELINKREFAKPAVDKNSETFLTNIIALEAPLSAMPIYSSQVAQVHFAALLQDNVSTKILLEYTIYANIFS